MIKIIEGDSICKIVGSHEEIQSFKGSTIYNRLICSEEGAEYSAMFHRNKLEAITIEVNKFNQ